jgi:hypothetical protein
MVLRKVNSALYYSEVLTSEEFQNKRGRRKANS